MDASSRWTHTAVLLHEAVDAVLTRPDGIYVDGTYGRGGHTRALLARLDAGGRLIAFDKDADAVAAATVGIDAIDDPRFCIRHSSYARLREELAALGVGRVDGVLLDLGVSSPQIDDPSRGFSFMRDGPLDMRMDQRSGETAAAFLARADERELARVIRDHGEERFAGAIARALVARRAGGKPVQTTAELSAVVAGAVKTREAGQNPATRTFQALRIHVNGELDELPHALDAALDLLAPGGRLAVISFHSLEDRIVKNFITRESRAEVDRRAPFAPPRRALRLRALARVRPGDAEVSANPRARSAVLRVAERLEDAAQGVTA